MAKINEGNKKLVSRREFLAGSGAVIAAIVLAACSRKTTETSTLTTSTLATSTLTTSTLATSTLTPSTLTPKYGGTLKTIGGFAQGTPGGWPAELSSNSDDSRMCLEELLRIDNKGNVTPWLAESYKLADDLKSITFTLRKGVTFHDGTDFNAQAAKWNVDNVIAAKSIPYFASVDIIDDYTIRVNFTKWSNLLWSNFAETGYVTMVSPTAFQKNNKNWMINHPIGTGPFKFGSFQPQVSYKVVRNPDYWGKDKQGKRLPYLDAIEITYVSDTITQKTAMQAGQGDMTDMSISSGKTTADYEALGLKVMTSIGSSLFFVPDTAHPDSPFANKEVREAMEYAIDREAIAKAFSYGYWPAAYQIPGPASNIYNANFTLGRKYDPEKAKQLLADAGYTNGFKTTIVVMPIPIDNDMVVAVQSYLSKVGIQAELSFTTSFPAFLNQMNSINSVLSLEQGIDNNANFNMPLQWNLDPTSMFNKNWLRTDEFLKLYNASQASPTPDANLTRAITDYMVQEALATPICGSGRAFAIQNYVMDTGYGEQSYPASWKPEQVWLNK